MPRPASHPCLALTTIGGLVLGCRGAPVALYPGPPRPATELALVEATNSSAAGFYAIDGIRVRASAVHLAPGRHEIWAHVRVHLLEDMMHYSIERYCGIGVDLAAGHGYQLRVVEEYRERNAAGSKVTVAAKVVDTSSGLEHHAGWCGGRPESLE